MKWTRVLVSIFAFSLLIVLPVGSQGLPEAFQYLLIQNSLQYAIPPGFASTPVIDNGDVEYDYSVKSTTAKLELRYRILSLTKELTQNRHRNSLFDAMATTMALNISNGKLVRLKLYPKPDVMLEFGADKGGSCVVPNDSEFGKGYKFCMISVIHKENVADAYAFFLCDDQKTLFDAIRSINVYHALKFK